MKRISFLLYITLLSFICQLPQIAKADVNFKNHKMAIIISEASYDSSEDIRNSAMGWAAVANMAGIPYDCLLLSEAVNKDVMQKYDLLVLSQCYQVEDYLYQELLSNLPEYLSTEGKNLIVDGPIAIFNELGEERDNSELENLIGFEYVGFMGDNNFRVKVQSSNHFISKYLDDKQYVTQHLTDGLDIIQFTDDLGKPLLISTDEYDEYPFLSYRDNKINRVVLVSDFGIRSGVSSFFRNEPEPLFYQNQIYNILTRSVQWALYGDLRNAIPVPQISNANLTAIIRLDADGSSNYDVQKETLDYLTDLSIETGVQTVYAFVSNWAERGGWDNIAPLAKRLEDYGGQIGTHSKTHRVTDNKDWENEFNGSITAIEENIFKRGYDIGSVDYLVNPGNTIPMRYYNEIAKRFTFFMTHGGEQEMPLGYGNLNWFTDANKDMVVLHNTPAPDYQWFYDGTWSYSTQQITAFEESIFDHMYHNIGKGVVFNEMWHDYAITANESTEPPQTKTMRETGSRIINDSNIALYDAVKAKFLTNDIYAPEPDDLRYKLLAMARWNYNWKLNNQQLEIEMDLSDITPDEITSYTGGMGIRIDNTNDYIQGVTINGEDHFAFADQMVILPNLKQGVNKITISLGSRPSGDLRLTYVSKIMPSIKKDGNRIETKLLTKSKAKFSFNVEKPAILLNADYQDWNWKGDNILKGFVSSDRTIVLAEHEMSDFFISKATLPIVDYKVSDSQITLQLDNNDGAAEIWFQAENSPKEVMLGNKQLNISSENHNYMLEIPSFSNTETLTISF